MADQQKISSSSRNNLVFPLKCAVQNYAWGKIGEDSEVAKLQKSSNPQFEIKSDAPYAELWMGTHTNGPSIVDIPGEQIPLEKWVEVNQDKLGSKVNEYFKGVLPFLFKVLSVNTSLSIQAHPNKVHAEKLHKEHPDIYKDPNHKPEMAIALTPFMGLCGFRPIQEVATFMKDIEEFRLVVGNNNACKLIACSKSFDMPLQREAMKECFTAMMNREKGVVAEELKKLLNKVKQKAENGEDISAFVGDILLKLDREFPGDVGCFSVYFMNVVTLQPGEAMFLEANLPHAYLSGDCMECMACSDNVVRAGLTPKFIDVHTLCEMLDYTGRPVHRTKFKGITQKENGVNVTVLRPPIWDFAVTRYEILEGTTTCKLPGIDSASIVICIRGEGTLNNHSLLQPLPVKRGSVFFMAANEEASISVTSNGMLLFRAYAGL